MKKRFIDSDIWEDEWFLGLPTLYKLFWIYLCGKCCVAGTWKPTYKMAGILLGQDISEKQALELFNEGKERVQILEGGSWYLPDFIPFQYNKLRPTSPPHIGVIKAAERMGLDVSHHIEESPSVPKGSLRVGLGLGKGSLTLKDKDKDKESSLPISSSTSQLAFDEVWKKYPPTRRGRMGDALILWEQRKAPRWAAKALDCLITSEEWTKEGGKYIPNLSKWIDSQMWDEILKTHRIVNCGICKTEGILDKKSNLIDIVCPACARDKRHQEAIAAQKQPIEGVEHI